MTLQEHAAHIGHAQEETCAFVAEQHKLAAETAKLGNATLPAGSSSPAA